MYIPTSMITTHQQIKYISI